MRVTNQLLSTTVANNLFRNTDRLFKTQNILASGKRINRPSDDPTGTAQVLHFRESVALIEQYSRNMLQGKTWLQEADSTLESVDVLLTRAKELAVYQATETSTAQTRGIAAQEIANIHDQIMQLANTKIRDRYIFAGHQTDTPPYYEDVRLGSQGVDQTTFSLSTTETWTIGVGAESFTVDVAAGDTLAAVRDAIELADEVAGDFLTAEIVSDGTGSNPDRLVLISHWNDGDREITVTNNTGNLSFSSADPTLLIDAAELSLTWGGTAAITSGGGYSGDASKTFQFDIASASGAGTVGTDDIVIHWTDGEYNEGDLVLDGTYVPGTAIDVFEGIQISVGAGTVNAGDTFSVDVWNPTMDGEYATYHGDNGDIDIIVGENTTAAINFVGSGIFDTQVDIFEVLHNLETALRNNDTQGISEQVNPLGEGIEQVVDVRSNAGTRLNRLEITENHWANFALQVTEKLAKTEDADLAKTITDLTNQEAIYQASLAASAKVIQPSLIDFLG